MSLVKQVLITATGVAAVAVSALSAASAHAATVTGTITGTWDFAEGSFNVGDVFTAEYSYDDSEIVPYDRSDIDIRDVGFNVPLSSLKVTVGSSYSHVFDFSGPSSPFGEFFFQDLAFLPPTYVPSFSSKIAGINAYDRIGTVDSHSFSAARERDQYGGIPFSFLSHSVEAGYGAVDPVTGYYTSLGRGVTRTDPALTDNVTFSPDPTATAVPTPALLPGLVGLGLGVLRKRKGQGSAESPEAMKV